MLKFLITGIIIYFVYKYLFKPTLQQGQAPPNNISQEGDIEIKTRKQQGEDEGEYIDYEEVD